MISGYFKKKFLQGLGLSNLRPFFPELPLIVLLFVLPNQGKAKDIVVSSPIDSLYMGEHKTNSTAYDTLFFYDNINGKLVRVKAIDSDQTCDCVTSEILKNGSVAVSLYFDQAEPAGTMEKILYVFSESSKHDLVRINLQAFHNKAFENTSNSAESNVTSAKFDEKEALEGKENSLDVFFFYSPGCVSCRKIKTQVLPEIFKRWNEQITLREINIDDPDGYLKMLEYRKILNVTDTKSPWLIVAGNAFLVEGHNTLEELERIIKSQIKTFTDTVNLDFRSTSPFSMAKEYLTSFTFWTIIGAGLLDGINPCAFATLVFFIGLLRYVGSSKKEVFVVGSGFTVSVFVVYLLLGLGAFKILQSLSIYTIISQVIYGLTLILLFVLLVLSVRDTVNYYKTGKTTEASLQLSTKSKQRIHKVMKKGLGAKNLLFGSIGIGVLVTLFEAACTGQVYLPTIVLVLKDDLFNSKALFFLILYNLMFIIPLIIVFGLVYAGTNSKRFVDWSRDNYGLTRILLSVLFLTMLVLMFWQSNGLF